MGLAGRTRTFQPVGRSSDKIERWYLLPKHPGICISLHARNKSKGVGENRDNSEGGGVRLSPTKGFQCSP
jgi:hypothetical protein